MIATLAFQGVFLWLTATGLVLFFLAVRGVLDHQDRSE